MFRFKRICVVFTLLIMTLSALICGIVSLGGELTLWQFLKFTLIIDAASLGIFGTGFALCIAVSWAMFSEEHIGFFLYTKKFLTRKFE